MTHEKNIEVSPEPVPNFTIARIEWGMAWPIHYNTFGIIFALIMIYGLNSLVALLQSKRKFQRRRTFITINILLIYFCLITSLSLFIDPYGSGEHIKEVNFRGILFIIIGLRIPCLTASFFLVQISFLELVKLQVYSKRLHSYRFIFTAITVHFLLILILDIFYVLYPNIKVILIVCQAFSMCVGIVVSFTSAYSGIKVIRYINMNTQSLRSYNSTETSSIKLNDLSRKNDVKKMEMDVNKVKRLKSIGTKLKRKFMQSPTNFSFKDKSVKKIAILGVFTTLFGFLLFGSFAFSISVVFMFTNTTPEPWIWYILQTLLGISETGIILTMAYVVRCNLCCK